MITYYHQLLNLEYPPIKLVQYQEELICGAILASLYEKCDFNKVRLIFAGFICLNLSTNKVLLLQV